MPQPEHFDVLVLGSGQGGQLIATPWLLARPRRFCTRPALAHGGEMAGSPRQN